MEQGLSPTDVEGVLSAIHEIDGASSSDETMNRTLHLIADLIPNDWASFNWMTVGAVSAVLYPTLGADLFEELNAVIADHWLENPLAQHFERTGDTRALTWTDVEVDRSWRNGELYQQFYVPLGVTQQLVVRLPSMPGTVAGLAVSRAQQPFDQRDRDVLTLLGRHVGVLLVSKAELAAMRSLLDDHGWKSMLADDNGNLTDRHHDAEPDDQQAEIIKSILRRTAHDRRDGRLVPTDPVEADWAGERVTVVVAPAAVPPHVVFVRRAEMASPTTADTSGLALLGLSPREREVAAQLCTGSTNRQIGESLGITAGTVKKHVQRIFVALGAETRTAAAAIVVRHLR